MSSNEKDGTGDDEPPAKKTKIETTNSEEEVKSEVEESETTESKPEGEIAEKKRILLLDICCGAGTIGLSLAKRVEKATAQGDYDGIFGLLGVELIREAVADAELNARDNHLAANRCV